MDRKGDLVAACDVGTSGVRCCLFDLEGRLAARAHRLWSYDSDASAPGALAFDPEAAWDAMADAIREATSAAGAASRRVRAASVTSQRLGLVLADSRGRGLRGIPNIDRRAAAEAAELGRSRGERLYASAGRWPGAGHPLSKLLWLRSHEPATLEKAASLLSLGDWFVYRLCGAIATEPTSACETCLYDVVAGRWDEGTAVACGIDAAILPAVLPPGTAAGAVSRETAARTGLPAGTIVAVGGGDTECGVLGLGARRPGDTAVVAGSSAPVERVVDRPILDREFRTLTNPFVLPARWAVESNAMLTGASYAWLASTLCDSKSDADRARAYAQLDREAAAVPIGSEGALAYLGSSVMDSRRGSFPAVAGILAPMGSIAGAALSRGCLARAALEAAAYAIRANVEQLREVTGTAPSAVLAGGGSLKSTAFRSILPDALGLPVLAADDEATTRGCAMCAATGAGLFGSLEEACAAMASAPEELRPDAARHEAHEPRYRRWLEGLAQARRLTL